MYTLINKGVSDVMKNKLQHSNLAAYMAVFVCPIVLMGAMALFYGSGFGNPLPYIFAFPIMVLHGLAAVSCFFFLNKSSSFRGLSTTYQVLLSLAYSLCGYILVQEVYVRYLCIFSLLPFIVYFYEKFIHSEKFSFGFTTLFASIFILDVVTGVIISICFVCHYICCIALSLPEKMAQLLHLGSCILLAFAMGGIFSVPALAEYMEQAKNVSYPGFFLSQDLPTLLSRFFMGSAPSSQILSENHMDLYFGLFFFLLFILYFFQNTVSLSMRIRNLIYTLFLIAILEFSPCRYLIQLTGMTSTTSVFYSYILIFFCLYLSATSIMHLEKQKLRNLIAGYLLFMILVVTATHYAPECFHAVSRMSIYLFSGIYLVFILLMKYASKHLQTPVLLLPCMIVLELICNTFIVTNRNFLPVVAPEESKITSDTSAQTDNSAYTDEELLLIISGLVNSVALEDDEILTYTGTTMPNFFENLNGCAKKIGLTENLFDEATYFIEFADSPDYFITQLDEHLYNIDPTHSLGDSNRLSIKAAYTISGSTADDLIVYDDYNGTLLNLGPLTEHGATAYMEFNYASDYSSTFCLLGYTVNKEELSALPELLDAWNQKSEPAFNSTPYYAGIGFTCIGVFVLLLLFFNKDKQKLYTSLNAIKKRITSVRMFARLQNQFEANYVYYLSFLIPFLLFMICMVIFNSIPFGRSSFLDEDGIALTLPSTLDIYYHVKESPNAFYSLNGGFGYSIYSTNALYILNYWLTLFSPNLIPGALMIGEAVCLGLCGLFMTYYLTHRLSGAKAKKNDYRLLIAAVIYSMNAYMLSMHGFPSWYPVFFAIPLLMLGMDYMMIRKKSLLYVIILTLIMVSNLYLALYSCIFLILWFFTYHFTSVKDFFQKGVRFALYSILAAGNSFFVIANTLLSSTDSTYQERDSVLPTFGFHTSFFEQWKQHMPLLEARAVNVNNGALNIFFGTLSLLLIISYFSSSKIKLSQKLKKLLPILIFYLSFNEQVLTFVWNGFHHQSNVPNRYVFLLMFVFATLAYDGIRQLKYLNYKKICGISIGCFAFITLCQYLSSGNPMRSYITTIGCILLFFVITMHGRKLQLAVFPQRLLVIFLIAELCINMIYTTSTYIHGGIIASGNYEENDNFSTQYLNKDTEAFRVSYPGNIMSNTGGFYNTHTNNLFNSFVNLHQYTLNHYMGFYSVVNALLTNYDSTPFGMTVSGTKYIYIPAYTTVAVKDLEFYDYYGTVDHYYVYENPRPLSYGFYVSEPICLPESITSLPITFTNHFASLYAPEASEPLLDVNYMVYCEDDTLSPNSYRFLNADLEPIGYEEALSLLEESKKISNLSSVNDLFMEMNVKPQKSGQLYLYCNEFISLGEGTSKECSTITIPYPNTAAILNTHYEYVTFNEEVMASFYDIISQQQLENISVTGNKISGITNYDQAGYTLITIPYSNGFKAYIDGNEVEIEDFCNAFIAVKTPAGKHQLELVYIPYGFIPSVIASSICMLFTLLWFVCNSRRRRKADNSITKKEG